MADVLVDTSILIDHLRGREPARKYLQGLWKTGHLNPHLIVIAELLEGVQDQHELRELNRFISAGNTIVPTEADMLLSLDLLKQWRLSHGVGWADCLIAATCLRLGISLATLNVRHLSLFVNLQMFRPY